MTEQALTPLAEIVAIGQGGVDPSVMGLGPTSAIKQALKKSGLTFEDIDVFELNEAFAAQSLGVIWRVDGMLSRFERIHVGTVWT